MYSKIAFNNIKKSYKDYSIYFLTLILGVCIFYSFNSIDSQQALLDIQSSNADYISRLVELMSGLSVFISAILGGLILYANNFLIKKRKKELGLYMILGMAKKKISRILVTETSVVGFISLIAGIILGIGVSQLLSLITLKLFDIGISEYRFAVSLSAAGRTVLYFGIMFLLVMIFNVSIISKYKIIDLLKADKKNESIGFKNPLVYIVSFVLCAASLIFSYKSLLNIGIDSRNPMFIPSIILLVAGTALFFFSLSGVVLYIASNNKRVYFKGLNIFVVKQMYSKVNTNFVSMAVICLMLFLTLIVLSTGISIKNNYENGIEALTPFDASVILYADDKNKSVEDVLKENNFEINKNDIYASYTEYESDVAVQDLFQDQSGNFESWITSFVKISDYNNMLKIRGEKEVDLGSNEVLILSSNNKISAPINEALKSSSKVTIKGNEYTAKNTKVIEGNLNDFLIADNDCTIVINDTFLADAPVFKSAVNIMYADKNRAENNKKYEQFTSDNITDAASLDLRAYSKDGIYDKKKGSTTSILFIGIYLGIVFLITSMAILSLQQLSEASDSIERYKALKKLGAGRKMINKTIFTQTLIYFGLPIILALMHSFIGFSVIHKEVSSLNQMDIRFSIAATCMMFILIYSVYFYSTYTGYKNIVKNSI